MSRVLVVAAHPDDETIGCGGSIVRHVAQGDDVYVTFMTSGVFLPSALAGEVELAVTRRADEARAAARVLGVRDVEFLDLPTLGVTAGPAEVACVERAIERVQPRVVYTHRRVDGNSDHRRTAEATLIATRFWTGRVSRELVDVHGFPVPPVKVTDGLSLVVALKRAEVEKKLDALCCYQSELVRLAPAYPRQLHTVRAQAIVWGSWIGTEWAEAFEPLWRRML